MHKREDLCTLPYMNIIEQHESLFHCLKGSYIDKCGNERCYKGYGEKCGSFPSASHTQRLLWGKFNYAIVGLLDFRL